MLNAAAIAGLNVLSLLHEPSAFAFKYGFDKESDFKVRACTAAAATQQPNRAATQQPQRPSHSSHAAATAHPLHARPRAIIARSDVAAHSGTAQR